jgi:hypothetical protein
MRGIQALELRADREPVTSGTSLRRVRPKRLRRKLDPPTVEFLELRIAALVAERQQLRADGAGAAELEHNRLEIVGTQRELGHALIERYLPDTAAQTAAA